MGVTATGYAYALPSGWVHLDIEPDRRAASVRRAVRQRVRREPRLAPHLAQLDRLLLSECAVAAAGGARRVSLLAEVQGEAVVTASVTFVVQPVPPDTRPPGALRRRWVEPARPEQPSRPEQLLVQILLPWPGRADVGVLTLSSSARPLWPALEATFDACVESFHWTSSR
jgi:hypothetical protein